MQEAVPLWSIGILMTPNDALAALRSLDLQPGRRAELARVILATTDPAEVRRIVYRARAEGDAAREAVSAEYSARLAAMRERSTSEDAPERPQTPISRPLRIEEGTYLPPARPVTVRFVEPRKPDAEIPERRANVVGPNRAQRVVQENTSRGQKSRRPNSGRTHGILGTYNWGCRCEPCTVAMRERWQTRKARMKRANEEAPGE